ncbi:ZIP family metal transporter [Subtercola boreus]|uniref:ZIP family metal transporter n=1 Tax=Subtercola boreus TaxID=120213 RepID=UPI001FEB779E|nr:ZIP family metal transporter [Subtercola boreus]
MQAASLVAFPIGAAIVGSVVAVIRPPGPRLSSAIQHFAAGVVLSALAGEVLPDLRNEGRLAWAVTGFIAGTAVMLALGAVGRSLERRRDLSTSRSRLPTGLLIAVGIDLLLDGLLVGLGTSLGDKQGLILTIALSIEILFIGLSVTTRLTEAGFSKTRSVTISTALGLTTGVGAIGGAILLVGATPEVLALVLAFGAAALLYLVVEELLIEAHEQAETILISAMFFLGFLTIYVLAAL